MPQSIKNFERIFLLSIVIGLIGTIINITQGIAINITIQSIVIFIITAALVLLTSRKKSNITKWILTILTVVGIIFVVVGFFAIDAFFSGAGYIRYLSLAQAIVQAVALYFLFTSDSRNYLQNKNNKKETTNN